MPFIIKLLGAGSTTAAGNRDIYTVPASATGGAIVSNVRLVNTTAAAVTVDVMYSTTNAPAGDYRILDVAKSIAANDILTVKPELTMRFGDKLHFTSSASGVEFVVSGIERV